MQDDVLKLKNEVIDHGFWSKLKEELHLGDVRVRVVGPDITRPKPHKAGSQDEGEEDGE